MPLVVVSESGRAQRKMSRASVIALSSADPPREAQIVKIVMSLSARSVKQGCAREWATRGRVTNDKAKSPFAESIDAQIRAVEGACVVPLTLRSC